MMFIGTFNLHVSIKDRVKVKSRKPSGVIVRVGRKLLQVECSVFFAPLFLIDPDNSSQQYSCEYHCRLEWNYPMILALQHCNRINVQLFSSVSYFLSRKLTLSLLLLGC